MFTGIIETCGEVVSLKQDKNNLVLEVAAPFVQELRVDQSIAHNGACLTVTEVLPTSYKTTIIKETLERTNLGALQKGDAINLERCMPADGRFDGHIVQGHVDQTGNCLSVTEEGGSWKYWFSYDTESGNVTVEKGSITINGVSLTVVDAEEGRFSVAIIPYTRTHTNFSVLKAGDTVNLEFDIVGKYVQRLLSRSGQ